MNLVEVTNLINAPTLPADMLEFYKEKRRVLVEELNADLAILGTGPFTLKELLMMSNEPGLAETVQ